MNIIHNIGPIINATGKPRFTLVFVFVLAVLVGALPFPQKAEALTITEIGDTSNTVNNTTVTLTTTAAVAAGETIVVLVSNGNGRDVDSVTDSAGNTYEELFDTIGSSRGVSIWWSQNPDALSSGGTITATYSAGATRKVIAAAHLGATAALVPSAANSSTFTSDTSITTGASVPDSGAVFGLLSADRFPTNDGSWTAWYNYDISTGLMGAYMVTSGAGTQTYNPSATNGSMGIAAFQEAVTYEQEGFRWRDDDGSESGASWLESQDTNITRATSTLTRLRILVDTANAASSNQYQLEYKLSTDSEWTTAPTTELVAGSTSTTTDSFENVADGSTDFSSTNLWKQASVTADDGDWQAESGATASGSTGADDGFDGTDFIYTEASDGGSCDNYQGDANDCAIEADIADDVNGIIDFAWNLDGDEIGKLSLDAYDGSSWTELWSRTGDQGVGSAWQESSVSWDAADGYKRLRFFHDVSGDGGSGNGYQADASLDYIRVGTSTSDVTAPVYVATSSNITASGEDTTAQLTAPSGKSTSDFDAGRIQDDENPADSVSIDADDYTELEWSLIASGAASVGEVYEFRVTNNGTPLDTYTVTPQWTIGSAVSAPTATTTAATNVGENNATMNGSITSTGGEDATEHGFEYGTASDLATVIATTTLGSFSGTGSFSENTGLLSPNTTYYFRAYATNSAGTGFGAILNFTTGAHDTTPDRTLRLFEGTTVKLYEGGRVILHQRE